MGEIIKNSNILDANQIVRPDLNLEKWPIWQPAKSKTPHKDKIIQRKVTLANGDKIIAKVKIGVGFSQNGSLTTEDQKVYYALVKYWEDKGKPTTQTYLSLKQLAKILKKKWGTNVIDSLSKSLTRLRAIPFAWENSYYNKNQKETLETLEIFNILSDLKIAKRKKNGKYIKEEGYFRFNNFILDNLFLNHTKPLLLDIVLNFKSEIAQLLYIHIDLIMADKVNYERCTKELFNDLKLESKSYQKLSDRKRKLTPALKELHGVKLSTGILIEAALLPAKEDDFKVVFKKDPYKEKNIIFHNQPIAQRQLLVPPPVPVHATELVLNFHKKFNRLNQKPSEKELDQAISLIAEYGEDQAKFIVDYAVKEAEKTKFLMGVFGATGQYKVGASQCYLKQKKSREIMKAKEDEKIKAEKRLLSEEQETIEYGNTIPLEDQEAIEQEAVQKMQSMSVIGHRFRGKSKEEILKSPTAKIFFENEKMNIIKKMMEESKGENILP